MKQKNLVNFSRLFVNNKLQKLFVGDSYPLLPSRTMYHNCNMPIKKIVHILDNELRLRSGTNNIDCHHSIPNSSTPLIIQNNNIGRFDELTHFFNIINGLFHQSAFTLGLSTYNLAPLFHLPELNVGMNMHIDQQSLEQQKIDFLKSITLYSIIGGNEVNTVANNNQRQNKPTGIIKFHTSNKNLMLGVNYRWTPSLTTTFRFGTIPEKRLWSHVEYRGLNETFELIGEYGVRQPCSIQLSYLSCLWQRMHWQIDGGIDLRLTSKEKLADIGLRLKRASDSIVFKCNLYHPLKHYLVGLQRCITSNFTVGLLAEKSSDYQQQQPIKFSLMSQWNLNKTGLRVNTLVNTQNEFGLALTHELHHFPLVLQTFGLYSWSTHHYKWGIGLQLLL